MNTTENSKVCGLAEWIPIPTNDSPISVNDLAVAVFNVLSGLFAFLSNLVIIVTAIKTPSLQRPSNILLCSLATADCLTSVTLQPIFVAWRILIQRVHESCSYQQELTTAFDVSSRLMTGWSLVSLAVISCDRCYALSKPFGYRAKVTKGGKYYFLSHNLYARLRQRSKDVSKAVSSTFLITHPPWEEYTVHKFLSSNTVLCHHFFSTPSTAHL